MRSVIIPAAGWGTRVLPASKAIPKELFPVFDRPIIQWVVEEAVAAGAKNVIFVTARGKSALEDHFDVQADLEAALERSKKSDLLAAVKTLSNLVTVHSVRQREQRGLGHAVWMGRHFIQDTHFAVALGDDLVDADIPGIQQLFRAHEQLPAALREGAGCVLLREVPESEVSKYGICEVDPQNSMKVMRAIEKPKPSETSSRLAILGRYFLPRSIFSILEKQSTGALGEIQLTDALQRLALEGKLFGVVLQGKRFDAGDRLGFLEANLHYYLKSSLGTATRELVKEYANEL